MKRFVGLTVLLLALLTGVAVAGPGGIGPGGEEPRPSRSAVATFYGKGSFVLASGQRVVSERDLFVAHRRLPFGTRVQFQRGQRILVARVLDRGPFVRGVSWDLSWWAARHLGLLGQGRGQVSFRVLGRPALSG